MTDTPKGQAELPPVKQAILELRAMRTKLEELESRQSEPIAIIGAGLRFPGGAIDLTSFWQLLLGGVNSIREVPRERWDIDAFYDPDPDAPGKMYARYGGFLDSIDGFDPLFFGISPREAASMDPQQRLLLEVGWETLENGGQAPDRLSGSATGIFLGIGNSDYFRMAFASPEKIDTYSAVGSASSITASRLAYLMNLKGPCLAVDTACSSSLVAVHLAVRSLRSGECSLALAGGVSLMLTPELSINFCKARMLTSSDKCKTFDAAADGYVRGEGCAMVALKRLSDAKSNDDKILAIIRGSAINQDGRTSGITAPSGPAQEAVITAALKDGGVKPIDVGYIEAHGTATPLGDPIEMHALGSVFGKDRGADRPLAIGSLKTNFGHLEAAAGIAGLIKAALALQKGVIPPHLHLDRVNPLIPPDQWPFTIPTTAIPFPADSAPRIAGVSSFGFSGTNAHVVLQAFDEKGHPGSSSVGSLQLLTVSAKTETALKEIAARVQAHICQERTEPFEDICFTASAGRSHFSHRLAVVADSKDQVGLRLSAFCDGRPAEGMTYGCLEDGGSSPKVAFLFTGQGSQYVGMGRDLYESQHTFRKALERCDEVLRPYLERSLLEVIYPEAGKSSPLDQTAYTQPAVFALEYALAELWRAWGIKPSVVMGHSVGEYAAACVAGVFSLEEGLKLIAARARLMQSLPAGGRMAAVFADEARVAAAIAPYRKTVSLACVNGPESMVISGAGSDVEVVLKRLEAEGIVCTPLTVSHAFHSPLMEPMVDEFERVAAEVTYAAPRIGLVSNVSGTLARGEEMAQAAYWRRHIRQPVRFSESMGWLCGQGYRMFMELGPSPVLLGMAARCFPEESGCVCLPSLKRGEGDCQRMLTSLAELYARGAAVDWDGFHRDRPHRRCALPTYPFQRERYWMESPTAILRSGSPDPGLVWRSTVEAGRRQSEQGPLDLRPESYAERWNCLERLTISLTAQTLLHLGIFKKANESFSVDEILQRCSIRPTYRHLLHRWLARLVDSDVLRIEGARFSNPHPVDLWPVKSQMETAREAFSDQPRFIEYIERCGNMLAEVLTGSQPALETLFPDGSSELAEWLYSEFSVSRYVSSIAACAVSALANAQAEHAPLRILEIGAGTGGTTGAVLRSLPPQTSEYWFTDMSEFFFDRAKERFAEFSSIRYGLLDIEQSPQGQGFAANSFHAVVATNVLHATRNLNTTLDHVQQLLTSGGVLVLSEVTRELAWYDITTGLIEGWQKFEDGWRSDSPILPVAKWMELLKSRGFEEVEVLPQKSSVAEVLGQHVIIARAPVKEQSTGMIPSAVSRPSTNSPQGDGADTDSERPSGRGSDEAVRKVLDSPADERRANLLDFVLLQVVRVLRMGPNHRPNRRSRLMDLGIDSLMALELRNRLGKALELPNRLPASLIFDYPTPESIALFLEQELIMAGVWGRSEEPPPAETAEPTGRSAEEIARLSDEQVEQMIMERLKKKQKEADI